MEIYNYYGLTDIGKKRKINEDVFDGLIHKNVLFLMVADGLGGKEGDIYASSIALNEMKRHITRSLKTDSVSHLKTIIEDGLYWTNRILLAYARANDTLYGGFGTTFTVCAINQNKDIIVGHAGNTRLYIYRDNILVPMTKDHTEAQELFDKGKIKKEELYLHPERATLTKALGNWENLECDVFSGKVMKEDIVVLCSDGIYNMLSNEEMQDIILEAGNSKNACEWLVEGANKRGGLDNSTAIISFVNL